MSKIQYTEEHEWLRIEDDGLITVGITDFAQSQLGDLVFIQLPEAGRAYVKGSEAAVIESVKTAGEILMPVNGTVVGSMFCVKVQATATVRPAWSMRPSPTSSGRRCSSCSSPP